MGLEEKQRIIEAWDVHIKEHNIRIKFVSINAEQEETFNASFKENILQSKKLSSEEKSEIIMYAKL